MSLIPSNRKLRLSIPAFGAATLVFCAAAFIAAPARTDEPSSDTIGAVQGDSISVQGPMSIEVVHGQVRTVLRSGTDIRVKGGQAQLELVEGDTWRSVALHIFQC